MSYDPESDPGHTLSCARREQESERRERATRETEPPDGVEEDAPVASRSSEVAAVLLEEQESLPRREMRALCALIEGASTDEQPQQVQPHVAALVTSELIEWRFVGSAVGWALTERGRICRGALEPMFAKVDAARGAR